MERLQRTIGMLLVAGLLGASAVGFAIAQGLKSVPPAITATDFTHATWFSPTCECPTSTARFVVTVSGTETVSVRVVTADRSRPVRQLATDVSTAGPISLVWDGRTDAGGLAPDGDYRVQVVFPKQPVRTLLDVMHLDRQAPAVRAEMPSGQVLAAGDAAAAYPFTLSADEPVTARATVYQVRPDSSVAEVWRQATPTAVAASARAALVWNGRRQNPAGPAAPGVYLVGFEATDRAGNVARAPEAFRRSRLGAATPVRVQGVEVTATGSVLTPHAGTLRYAVDQVDVAGRLTPVRAGTSPGREIPSVVPPGAYATSGTIGGQTGTGFAATPDAASVLLIVPTYTWQAANPYDAATDGFPDVPPGPLDLLRPLPDAAGAVRRLATTAAPALRRHRAFGAVTDAQLEAGVPSRARLVVVAGLSVWTDGLLRALRTFAHHGGRVLVVSSPFDHHGIRQGRMLIDAATPRDADLHGVARTVSSRP